MSAADEPVRFTVDALEAEGLARLEDPGGATVTLPRSWLPADAGEGDVLRVRRETDAAGHVRLEMALDPEATEVRRREAQALRDRLPRAGEGDIVL